MPAWLLALALVLPAAKAEVPVEVQIPAFLKALGFDRNLDVTQSDLAFGIVFDPENPDSTAARDRIVETHRTLTRMRVKGKRVRFVPIPFEGDKPLVMDGVDVLIVVSVPEEALERLVEERGTHRRLTFATMPSYVERGLAVGMELAEGRPGFVVNLEAASDAGASFESSFLALCRIVERN